jgi:hypothetical protein
MTGQLVKQFEDEKASFNISDLASGIYIIEVLDTENNRSSIKLIKK